MKWYNYLNPWNYVSPTGKLNPWRIQGAEDQVDVLESLMPDFAKPKSFIIPGMVIGGLLFFVLIVRK